jgi:hypothetical protein
MSSLIDKIRGLRKEMPPASETCVHVPLDDQAFERLLLLLCDTRDDELSCEEVFGRLDEYVDCLAARQDAGVMFPLFAHHLGFCADCRDELEALLHALESAADE